MFYRWVWRNLEPRLSPFSHLVAERETLAGPFHQTTQNLGDKKWDGREGWQSRKTVTETIFLGGGVTKRVLPKCAALAKWLSKRKSYRSSWAESLLNSRVRGAKWCSNTRPNRRICLLGALPKQQSASDPVFFNKTDTNMPSHVSRPFMWWWRLQKHNFNFESIKRYWINYQVGKC